MNESRRGRRGAWFGALPGGFPNRHAVGHGRFEATYFTAEMSIKVFLLLDTLHHLFNAEGM